MHLRTYYVYLSREFRPGALLTQVIRVPDEFTAQEGVKLLPELIVGSMLGGGYQGAVYKLFKPDGSDPKQLLKVPIAPFVLCHQRPGCQLDAKHTSCKVQVMKFKSLNPVTGLDIGKIGGCTLAL